MNRWINRLALTKLKTVGCLYLSFEMSGFEMGWMKQACLL